MKKSIVSVLLAFLVLLFASIGFAADVVQSGNDSNGSYTTISDNMMTATFTVTADGSGNVALFTFENVSSRTILGWYIMCADMSSATDDAFQVLVYSNGGGVMLNHTTTAATTGEPLKSFPDRWPVYAAPKIDVVGLTATEIATITLTFVR